jgi:glucose/arabinose dehydrogenase
MGTNRSALYLLAALFCAAPLTEVAAQAAAKASPPGYGPIPQLAMPDTSHAVARFPRVIGWPAGELPRAPLGFEVTLYAAGFHNPRWLYVLPNGDLLVVESNNPGTPRDWQASPELLAARFASKLRGPSANRITLLRDTTGDGVPDLRSIFIEGLNQPFGIALVDDYLYVANTDALWRYRYTLGQLEITTPGELVLELPAGGYNNHWTRNVIVRPDGRKLYVSVGSATNVDIEGIDALDPRRAAILELDPDGADVRIFASGLRNPVGMAWEPGTHTLWTVVNERDGLGDDLPPDYVTRVLDGAFYGWPYAYFGPHEDPRHEGRRPDLVRRTVTPDYATGAHTSTINLLFYQGSAFPERYREGLFIAQRGSWNRSEFAGFRVAFLPFRAGVPAGPMEDFLSGFVAPDEGTVYGRPIGLAVLPDGSLLVSDDAANVVWRVQWNPRQ